MALSLQASVFVKQKVAAFPGLSARLTILVNDFLSLLVQHSGDPDLQFVPFSLAGSESLTAANVGARVYAVVAFNPTVGGFLALDVGDSGDEAVVALVQTTDGGHQEACALWPGGVLPATNSDVTIANGGSDLTKGFVLLGAIA